MLIRELRDEIRRLRDIIANGDMVSAAKRTML